MADQDDQDEDQEDDKPDREPFSRRFDAMVPDALKKAVAAGVGAVFLTEEGIRNAVAELKLPKEVLNYLLSQGDKTRRDVFRAVSKEVKKYLRSSEMEKLLAGVLQKFTIEVKAEIRFKTNEKGGVKLEVGGVETKTRDRGEGL